MYRSLATLAFVMIGTTACGDNKTSPASPDARVPTPDAPATSDAGVDADLDVDFTESYGSDTGDEGNWLLTTDAFGARTIRPKGGNPGGYLYAEVTSAIPTWATASQRYQPGVNDEFKRNSIFVGNYYAEAIETIGVDLEVLAAGSWTSDRTLTLQLLSWDVANNGVAYEALYSLPDMVTAPAGWNHYDFNVDARSTTVPAGWMFTRGDGTAGTDADWATFMHQIDLVGFGYWKPGYYYPGLNSWNLGIDNIHITSHP